MRQTSQGRGRRDRQAGETVGVPMLGALVWLGAVRVGVAPMSCLRSTVELVDRLSATSGRLTYAEGRWRVREAQGGVWRVHGVAAEKAVREGLVVGGGLDDFGARVYTLSAPRTAVDPPRMVRDNRATLWGEHPE